MKKKSEGKINKSLENDMRVVLSKIKDLLDLTNQLSFSYADYTDLAKTDPARCISPRLELVVLERLQEIGVVQIDRPKFDLLTTKFKITGSQSMQVEMPPFEMVHIRIKEFEKLYKDLGGTFLNSEIFSSKKQTLYLARTGKLYRVLIDGSEGGEYKLRVGKIKHGIIEQLASAGKDERITTEVLADKLKTTSDNVMKEIGAIRCEIEKHFQGITGKDFIPEAVKGCGYCLGSSITVKIE